MTSYHKKQAENYDPDGGGGNLLAGKVMGGK